MKNTFLIISIAILITSLGATSTFALTQEEMKERKQEIQKRMDEKRDNVKTTLDNMTESMKLKKQMRVTGEVTSIDGTTLTLNGKDGKIYTINTDSSKMLRKFGGKSEMTELAVSDILNVIGTVGATDTTINAQIIRNTSVQKRFGAFFGTVVSKANSDMVIASEKRGNQTVKFTTASKIIDRQGKVITVSDIQIGDKVRVKGVWDNKLNTITVADKEREGIKDFSLPKVASDSAEMKR